MNAQMIVSTTGQAVNNYLTALNQLRDVAKICDVSDATGVVTDADCAVLGCTAAQFLAMRDEVDNIVAQPIPDILFHGRMQLNV